MIREDWINYFNNLSLFVMFTNQLILIHLTKGMFREFSVQKSVHSRYTTSGIPFAVRKQKPSKHIVSRVFKWAQMDSNHRSSA